MNYSDFGEIIEDGFSGSVFGKDNQLAVLGKCGKNTHTNGKYSLIYAVKCFVCSKDPELYGAAIFKSTKSSLVKGQIPCGCSKSARRDERYYNIICHRKAIEMGYNFLGWAEPFTDRKTKIILECKEHGVWKSGIINNFINRSVGCRACRNANISKLMRQDDSLIISKFMSSGGFALGTLFSRSERKDNLGRKVYWQMWCPECEEEGTSTASSLNKGSRCCGCSKQRPIQAYIYRIEDDFGDVAVKFGISSNAKQRIKRVNRESCYDVSILEIYSFPSVDDCRSAEKACIDSLVCGVLSEGDFPDGYTETTYLYNTDEIRKIYKAHGGVNVFSY